mmetsp:Transcript_6102/g.17225  ORF Transcript_6102/g.17225 Transcript_6102/m.17225 type:complete len:353 (+) Transcript_6102:227-1285(+)
MTPPRLSATTQRRTASSSGPLQSRTVSSAFVFSIRRSRLSASTRCSRASSCSADTPRRKGTTSAGSPRLSRGSTLNSTSSGSSAAPSSTLIRVPSGARSAGPKRSRRATRRDTSTPRTIQSRTRGSAWLMMAPRRLGCEMRCSMGTKASLITAMGSCRRGIRAPPKRRGSTAEMTSASASGGASSAAASFSAETLLTTSTAECGSNRRSSTASCSRTVSALMIGATTSKKHCLLTPLSSSQKMFLATCWGTSSSRPLTAPTSAYLSIVTVLRGCRSMVQLRTLGYLHVSATREQSPKFCWSLSKSMYGWAVWKVQSHTDCVMGRSGRCGAFPLMDGGKDLPDHSNSLFEPEA